jgi:opacity protein-like surface antigen
MKSLAFAVVLAALATGAFAQDKPMPAPNTLTAAEKSAGWKLLFDGKTTAGWRGFKQAQIGPGWKVDDGILSPDPKVAKDIITKDQFENFELTFDWRISKGGNSGVMFHVLEVGDETYESGPEYQILDNARGEPPLEQAGSLFALVAPSMDMTRPVGEFNHAKIVVDHGKAQHWLNGMMVAEYDINSADFMARVAASKFKRWPQFATGKTGFIALQNHGDDVAFRKIKIRPLP